jgi:hypothetical protein
MVNFREVHTCTFGYAKKKKKSENVHYINPASNAILIHVNGLGYL